MRNAVAEHGAIGTYHFGYGKGGRDLHRRDAGLFQFGWIRFRLKVQGQVYYDTIAMNNSYFSVVLRSLFPAPRTIRPTVVK